MVSNLIGDLKQKAENAGLDKAKGELGKADKLLDGGPARTPTDIAKEEAKFLRGDDLSTPAGDVQTASAVPVPKVGGAPAPPKDTTLNGGKKIEFIHFGYAHPDFARNFDHPATIDDLQILDTSTIVGSRAIMFRAALEREAVLLGALCIGTQMAFKADAPDAKKLQMGQNHKDAQGNAVSDEVGDAASGALGKLLGTAGDLVGGKSSGAAETASSADLSPFLDKLNGIWSPLNQTPIEYDALRDAGIKLHEVRVNLRRYVRDQLASKRSGPQASKTGLLSSLPVIGALPLPPVLGEIVGFMQKVTGKMQDAKEEMIFDLMLAMGPAIDGACHRASIEAIRGKRAPIYPVWFLPPPADAPKLDDMWNDEGAPKDGIAGYDPGDVLTGNIIPGASGANKAVKKGVDDYYNKPINDATNKPMQVIDFLTKKVDPAPGSAYIAEVFQVTTAPDKTPGPLAGGAALGKLAYESFAKAVGGSDTIPGVMSGFVETMVAEVFTISAEFLRAVYEKLVCLQPTETISTDEILKAGHDHILLSLVDFALQKSGLDKMLEKLQLKIPGPPTSIPLPGIKWPTGIMSVQPIIAALKGILTEKLGPYLDPVVAFLMAGLAERLNAQRSWATPAAMTMEAHVAQLPGEMTALFLGLFGPLWGFLNDTVMGVVNDEMKKVLGPAGDAVGLAKDGLGKVSGLIADAERKADQAKTWAKTVEDKVGDFFKKLQHVNAFIGKGGLDDVKNLGDAADDIKNAATSDPFKDGGKDGPKVNPVTANASFKPADRDSKGIGTKVDKQMLDTWTAAGGDAASGEVKK